MLVSQPTPAINRSHLVSDLVNTLGPSRKGRSDYPEPGLLSEWKSWANKAAYWGWASGLWKRLTTALSRKSGGLQLCLETRSGQMTKQSLSSGSLQSPGPKRPLKDESSPGLELGCPLKSPICHVQGSSPSHPPPSLRGPPLLSVALRPHPGPRGQAGYRPQPPPPAAPPPGRAPHWGLRLGSRGPGAGESAPTRLGRPLRPQSRRRLSVPAGPSFARAPGPVEKGGGRGGPNLGGPSRSPHPTGTCLLHISNSFLSHFLARGGVSQTPPRAGPAPGPSARLPPGSSPVRPRSAPGPASQARPLARSSLRLRFQACLMGLSVPVRLSSRSSEQLCLGREELRAGGEEGLKGTNPLPSDEDMEDQGEKETGPGSQDTDTVGPSTLHQNDCREKTRAPAFFQQRKRATEWAVD